MDGPFLLFKFRPTADHLVHSVTERKKEGIFIVYIDNMVYRVCDNKILLISNSYLGFSNLILFL